MSNNYNDLSVFNAIEKIKKGEIIIPDIQREYCWSPSDIIELFKSIIFDFPIGSFIFWEVKGNQLNECTSDFYGFLSSVWKHKKGFFQSDNELLNKNFRNESSYNVVLDGQQRLTSLYLILDGNYHFKKPGVRYNNKESYYEKKDLYYVYNWDIDNEDADKYEPFMFLSKEEENEEDYYNLKNLLKYNSYEDFCTEIDQLTINMDNKASIRDKLKLLFRRLNEGSQNESLVHYYVIKSTKFDDALDVFVRVNSTGKKLNKTDLLFGTLINKWERDKTNSDGRRKEIEKFLECINQEYGFDFNKDFLLRTCLVLVNDGRSGISMQEIASTKAIEKIKEKWGKIKDTFKTCSKYLKEIDLNGDKVLSYNAIIPIMFYVFLGGKINNKDDRNELKKYFAISFAKGLFGGSSNMAITNTCNSIKKNISRSFSINYFSFTEFSGGRNFNIDIKLINKWLETYNKGAKTYHILMLLSPNLSILENKYDQDHSHADTLFNDQNLRDNGVLEERMELWKNKRNHLPNLSFMQFQRNRSKNDSDLKTWMEQNTDKVDSLRLLPIDISYEFKNFEEYYILRRSMMKYKLCSLFDVPKEEIKAGDRVTINSNISIKGDPNYLKSGMNGVVLDINEEKALVRINSMSNACVEEYIELSKLYIVEDFEKKLDFI